MDFGKTNSKVRDFDLNIPYVEEDFDLNAENKFPLPISMNTNQTSQNSIEKMNKEDANKRDNVQSSEMDTTTQANSATSEDLKHDEPKNIASASFVAIRISRQHRSRRGRHLGGEVQQSTNAEIFCTNFFCKTKRTPMWRKGPLGPKTLCNACGLQYVKMVKGKGSDEPVAVPGKGCASTAYHDGASPDNVPTQTMEGDSNLKMSAN